MKRATLIAALALLAAPGGGAAGGESRPYSEIPHHVRECVVPAGRFVVAGDLVVPAGGEEHPVAVLVWGSGPAGRGNLARPSPLVTAFLEAGYALFIPDKPGSGSSTGEFTPGRLLRERAGILAAEIEFLRRLDGAPSPRVGVYGSSQAGYVIALAIEGGARVDFLAAVSCPAESGIEQSAYLVERQLLCAGYDSAYAARAKRYFVQRARARAYGEYLEAARFLDDNPVVRDELGWAGVADEERFAPRSADSEDFYDPAPVLAALDIPVLALFGEKDTQIDPVQGAAAYEASMRASGDPLFRVFTIPGADHNMRRSLTGCMREQRERYGTPEGRALAPGYLDALGGWLRDVRERLLSRE